MEFYSALRGMRFHDASAAAEDFVEHGMRKRLSPHPFLDFASLAPRIRRAWRQGRVLQVLEELAGEDGRVQTVGPLSEPADPDSARAALLTLAERIGHEPAGESFRTAVDWADAGQQDRLPGRTSVVMVAADVRRTARAVTHLLQHVGEREVEVVVVDCGSPPHVSLGLHAALHEQAGVVVLRVPATVPPATGTNLGVAQSTGDTVVLLEPHVVVRRGWLTALLATLEGSAVAGAQPVVLRADDTIRSAGLVVLADGRSPVPLLPGHPKEDARRLQGQPLMAISGEAMALRAADVVAVGGLEARGTYAEAAMGLCARLLELRPDGFRLATQSIVNSGLDEPGFTPLPSPPLLPADPRIHERIGLVAEVREPSRAAVVTGLLRHPDQLRWSVKLPSPAGGRGDRWGDTHFADALATALRDLGQDVVTRRRKAHTAGPTHLDDVSLALRGLYPVPPTPGQRNVLWVISHPDDVDPREFEGYELVCAASVAWSAELSARTGREVVPLLQATEFRPPASAASAPSREPRAVFVGVAGTRRDRPLVRKAVQAGVDLTVYGRGWEDLPSGVWRGEYVDNAHLPDLYHRHGIVLADHWPDMARNGFIANRVFDAVASGARVICDDVVGVHDVFDPRDVVIARTPEDIAKAVTEFRHATPVDVPRPDMTFHERARTLLARVRDL